MEGKREVAAVDQPVEGVEGGEGGLDPTHLNEDRTNAHPVVCRLCSSQILLPKKAAIVEKEINMRQKDGKEVPERFFWAVKDMFDFENIGFTKSVDAQHLRYLTCADCEQEVIGAQLPNDPSSSSSSSSPTIYLSYSRVRAENK
ncbi:Guanine nucleotide dissociation stimulator for Sec4p, variant 2 [Balamuthia mandrillaris]